MMTNTEIIVLYTVVFPVIAVAVAISVICVMRYPRQQVAPCPQQALEVVNGVAQVPDGNGNGLALEIVGVDGVVEVVRVFDGRLLIPSPFEPPLMNPTYFLVSAILILFVFSLLIYVVIRAAKTLLCTNHFVRIH